ncbi:hypothetical protein ACFWIY_06820 [Streptomyces sioyaensis]
MRKGAQGMPLEVRQIKEALLREFRDQISMEDFEKKDPVERDSSAGTSPN